jgi:hypothetical protein
MFDDTTAAEQTVLRALLRATLALGDGRDIRPAWLRRKAKRNARA